MDAKTPTPVPVAIIGIGCLFPGAESPRAYWKNILERVDGIKEIPANRWDPNDYFDADPKAPDRTYARRGGFLSPVEFSPLEFGITPNTLAATDSTQLLGLVTAKAALEDAGYGADRDFDRTRASVILGVTGTQQLVIPLGARLGHPIWRRALRESGIEEGVAEQVVRRIADSYVGWQEDSFPGLLGNVVAGRIANKLNLHGTNCVVDAACASSLSALHLALLELGSRRCDLALSGGMDTFNDIFMYLCFSKTPALSPTGDARPFAENADGTILGEGLGCMVLKRLADAERDGDRIYAVIRAVGTSSDGKGNAIYAPNPDGQKRALRHAYQWAGVTPESIDLVEAHGTGTRAGDAAEIAALTEVYREDRSDGTWCALGSVKSQIGHTKAAAGAAGLIKAALALHHKVLPPTIKVEQPAEIIATGNSPFYVNTDKRPWLARAKQPRRAAVSSFGFGGSNFHCVLEEHRPEKPEINWDGEVQIVGFSAKDQKDLRAKIADWFQDRDWPNIRAAAQDNRAGFRPEDPCRLVLALHQGQDLTRLKSLLLTKLTSDTQEEFWSLPDGAFFGRGNSFGKLALLFPGQGSQYPGMLRDLACQFPQMLTALQEANDVFVEFGKLPGISRQGQRPWFAGDSIERLSDLIYPHPAFTGTERRRQEERLRATAVTQPALGAVSLGAWRILQHFGVCPDAVAGHSFGELTALCVAGRLSEREYFQLASLRGRLMQETSGTDDGMVAVSCSGSQADELLGAEQLRLVIANRNAPKQTVLSGPGPEIERIIAILQKRGIAAKRLPVGAAFHSPLVAGVETEILAALPLLPPGTVPVFANSTGRAYPTEPDQARRQLAGQLAAPVLFQDTIENMYAAGCRTFVEVGPGGKLTSLVRAILDNRPHYAASIDSSTGKNSGQLDLARLLALLSARGHCVRLTGWDDGRLRRLNPSQKNSPGTVMLTGANFRPPAQKAHSNLNGPIGVGNGEKLSAHAAGSDKEIATITMNNSKTSNHSVSTTGSQELASHSLDLIQQHVATLQKLSEQTAQLHRQFLDGQDRALQVFQTLVHQQQGLLGYSANSATPRLNGRKEEPSEGSENGLILPAMARNENHHPPSPRAEVPAPANRFSEREREMAVELPRNADSSISLSPPSVDGASAVLLQVVADKTGYPADTLGLDMELDADLGIDSIKRVEIFATLQERLPDAPAVGTEQMPGLRTLGDVAAFLQAGGEGAQKKKSPAATEAVIRNQHVDGDEEIFPFASPQVNETLQELFGSEAFLEAPKNPDPFLHSITRVVSLETCPVLHSHVLGGRAVVPLVLHLEWLAHGAMHAHPGLLFHGFDDLRILKGIKLDAAQECSLRIVTGKSTRHKDEFHVPAEIHQETESGTRHLHSTATIILAARLPERPPAPVARPGSKYRRTIAADYESRLFHGPALQGIRHIDSVGPDVIVGRVAVAPPPTQWLSRPLRGSWLAEPLVLDASFQLMVLWCWENYDMPLLPTALGSYRQYRQPFSVSPNSDEKQSAVQVVARITSQASQCVVANIDFLDDEGKLLAQLRDGQFIRDSNLKESFRQNRLLLTTHSFEKAAHESR